MRTPPPLRRWSTRSNEQALANAREATTRLSRLRVEREEVELYLRQRYGVGTVADDAGRAASDR